MIAYALVRRLCLCGFHCASTPTSLCINSHIVEMPVSDTIMYVRCLIEVRFSAFLWRVKACIYARNYKSFSEDSIIVRIGGHIIQHNMQYLIGGQGIAYIPVYGLRIGRSIPATVALTGVKTVTDCVSSAGVGDLIGAPPSLLRLCTLRAMRAQRGKARRHQRLRKTLSSSLPEKCNCSQEHSQKSR